MTRLPNRNAIDEFHDDELSPLIELLNLLNTHVEVIKRDDYIKLLDLDLSESSLKVLQEEGLIFSTMESKAVNKLEIDAGEKKLLKNFIGKKNIHNRLNQRMVEISNWWLNNFVTKESNFIMFRDTDESYNDVRDFKKEFAEVTNLNIDLLNLFIHHYKLNKDKMSQLNERNARTIRESRIQVEQTEKLLEELNLEHINFKQLFEKEIQFSILPSSIKSILKLDDTTQNWDDPRTLSQFSIDSKIEQNTSDTYYNGYKKIRFGVESKVLPLGDLFIGWDDKNNTADSCRASYSRNHVSISISDGATQGGFNSGLFAYILTILTSNFIPVSQNGMYYYNRKPMIKLYNKYLQNPETLSNGIHSKIRNLGFENAKLAISSQYRRKSLATIADVKIHSSGHFQTIRFGDCCIFKLTKNDQIEKVNFDENVREGATNLIGPEVQWNRYVRGKSVKVNGFLESNELLFGCTDQVALYCLDHPDEASKLIRQISTEVKNSNSCAKFFTDIATNIQGEDDLTFFVYQHIEKPFAQENVKITSNNSKELIIDDITYTIYQGDRYYVSNNFEGGVKRLPKSDYLNLLHFKNSKGFHSQSFIDYSLAIGNQGTDDETYLVLMPHLATPNFVNLSTLLEEIYKRYHDKDFLIPKIESIQKGLSNLQSDFEANNVTHLDLCPSNVFVRTDTDMLEMVCIDPNAFYCEGSFILDEIGHAGMYGTEKTPTHVSCLFGHKLPMLLMQFSLELLKLGMKEEDKNWWKMFCDTNDCIIFSPDDIDIMALPDRNKKSKEDFTALRKKILHGFNIDEENLDIWLKQLNCDEIYSSFV